MTVTADEILRDLLKFVKDFNVDLIPHMNEEEINAYRTEKLKTQRHHQHMNNNLQSSHPSFPESGNIFDLRQSGSAIYGVSDDQTASPNIQQIKMRLLKPTHFDKHQVTCYDILDAFKEIEHEDTARLIGLISHFVYWVVFGSHSASPNPLNHFHLKQLFISILQCVADIEKRQDRKKIFSCFIMPLILLTIRLEVESIYRNTYPSLMSSSETEDTAMRQINCLITEIIDPKLYYSRFSFLESGKEAIDIKHRMHKMSNLKSDASP